MSRAQQNSTGRLRRASLAIGLAALLATTACGAGQITQTDSQRPAVNGSSVDAGAIAVRDARLAYPHDGHYSQGGQAAVIASLINTGTEADTLVEVTSPIAGKAELTGDTALPGGVALAVGTPNEDFHPETTTAAPTTTTAPTTTGTETTGATTTTTTPVATTGAIELGKLQILLTGLTEDLYPGRVYPVTFVFAKAGAVTVELPIAAPTDPRESEDHGNTGEH
ncbi:copper chaperone PCu(A)C [Actinokineospora sp. UTMC 2448]|uniref:copper chaperone PCu(A)C n=1 Tax=Actinokineospora sp. UTMC 2448 TaxID=2268449 RepID=UPI0021644E6B|nr:copper chaperone PCu(A)C [Actinokineospora sp. UTMC 2448]UVS76711.1 hypothetical protein Actkin_00405 [Actinokineospora sp. UTMC 2448]